MKVIVHFFADAAQRGIIEPEAALEALAKYVELPEGESSDVIDALMDMVRAPRAEDAEPEKSEDEQVADYMSTYNKPSRSRRR